MDLSLEHLDLETREVVLQPMRNDLEERRHVEGDDDNSSTRVCLVCTESFRLHDLARLPCNHEYCRGCLRQLFTTALTDESLIPARCCRQNIPDTDPRVQVLLGPELVGKYRAKKVEAETTNRTYCHRPGCSTFILPQHIVSEVATCPECRETTCSICKAATHEGTDCPEDEAAKQLLDMAKEESWRQCRACNTMVELREGCNHITCRCGAEFCYVCGEVWTDKGQPGACGCDLFIEEDLLRQAARGAPRAQQDPERIYRVAPPDPERERLYRVALQERERMYRVAPQEPDRERIYRVVLQERERMYREALQERERMYRVAQQDHERMYRVAPQGQDRERNVRNHLCEHTSFRRRAGVHDCQECGYRLWRFIMTCSECNINLCLRCSRNRLR